MFVWFPPCWGELWKGEVLDRLIFSVFDSKAAAFLAPFFVRTEAEAVRWFGLMCRNPEHDFGRFAEDFMLFELGSFREETGVITPLASPRSVVLGSVLKATLEQRSPLREVV